MKRKPLAIVGIGCRLPGGSSSPEKMWELLCNRVDAIKDVPREKWDERKFYDPNERRPGKYHNKQFGLLDEDVFQFDPYFFGVSPKEAEMLDPQQRLMLEITWEAFEDAGMPFRKIKGTKTGVFVGGFLLDGSLIRLIPTNLSDTNSFSASSSSMTLLSNRISYVFDLRGPSVSIDTACSSSLVTTYYACESIWNGNADMALAGGVSVMICPNSAVIMSKGGYLASHSRCKAFDKDADGYVRSEGAGVILIKPLERALKDNDDIYSLIIGAAVNHDGKTVGGIGAPNYSAQVDLIRSVHSQAGIDSADVQYIEAHGTGTQAGDIAESKALGEIFSDDDGTQRRCIVGAVKTNIGHTEAVAGIAGLIKASLCLKHKAVPSNLHFDELNPNIDLKGTRLHIPTEMEQLSDDDGPILAGVNSFGYGGTNVHVLLRSITDEIRKKSVARKKSAKKSKRIKERARYLVPVSARAPQALKDLVGAYRDFLTNSTTAQSDTESTEKLFHDFIHTLAFRRSHHNKRVAFLAESYEEMLDKFAKFTRDEVGKDIIKNDVLQESKLAFVFPGMGAQWWPMGKELMAKEPVFRRMIKRCDKIYKDISGWSLLDRIMSEEGEELLKMTSIGQPAIVMVQVALAALWESWGIKPEALLGHSVGEISAAYVSGGLSLEDTVLLVYHRANNQQKVAGKGMMLAVGQSVGEVKDIIAKTETVSIGAVNSPSAVTLSGDESELKGLAKYFDGEDIFNKFLAVEIPYHSKFMDDIKDKFLGQIADIKPQQLDTATYSTVTTELLSGKPFDGDYWWRNTREPVRFHEALNRMISEGYTSFLEVGPHPVLTHSIKECLYAAHLKGETVCSIRRDEDEVARIYRSLAELYTLGFAPDWSLFVPDGEKISLPHYPWQREYYWTEDKRSIDYRLSSYGHVFLETNLHLPEPTFEVEVNTQYFPYLNDHKVYDAVIVPGAMYVEAGLALADHINEGEGITLEDIDFRRMLVVEDDKVQTILTRFNSKRNQFEIYSRFEKALDNWTLHARGTIRSELIKDSAPAVDIETLQEQLKSVDRELVYQKFNRIGLNYGDAFKRLDQIWGGEDEFLAKITREQTTLDYNEENYLIHPTLLDACFQAFIAAVDYTLAETAYVPVKLRRITLRSDIGNFCWAYGTLTEVSEGSVKGDVTILGDNGEVLATIKELQLKPVQPGLFTADSLAGKELFYNYKWLETAFDEEIEDDIADDRPWVVFDKGTDWSAEFIGFLKERGVKVIQVLQGNEYEELDEEVWRIKGEKEEYTELLTDIDFVKVVYLWSLTEAQDIDSVSSEEVTDLSFKLLELAQALALLDKEAENELNIVTCGTQVVKNERGSDLAAASLSSLGISISNEYLNVPAKVIDIAADLDVQQMELLYKECLHGKRAQDVAFRGARRYERIIAPVSFEEDVEENMREVAAKDAKVSLKVGRPGVIDSLYYQEEERRAPEKDEIEIQAYSWSINYKDLLKILGMLPPEITEETYFGDSLGMECSGKVVRVGEDVELFKVGDEVYSMGAGFSSYITVKDKPLVLQKPDYIRFHDACSLVVYATAYYCLIKLGNLKAGESILIHNATGGVGISAVEIAAAIGAKVFATAGTERKRRYLRERGIEHVFDSRSLQFAADVMEATDGEGVDFVLNAQAGDALIKGFEIVRPFGRFVEIGKRDILDDRSLPMKYFDRNVTFSSVDLDKMLIHDPERTRQLLMEAGSQINKGDLNLEPIPVEVFNAGEVKKAFKFMRSAKQIGKIVLDFHDQVVDAKRPKKKLFKNDGTYLITGGTRGLGLELAKWMARKGAGGVVLVSRSGAVTPKAQRAIKQMERKGKKVLASATDVTDKAAMNELFRKIAKEMPPLRGVFHGAMVLKDKFITNMARDEFQEVVAPKVEGALILHELTLDKELDYFVSFSSVSAVIGNPGQVNYIVANTFLDDLAIYRKMRGLPATTISWGPIGDVGAFARSGKIADVLVQAGIEQLALKDIFGPLEAVLESDATNVGIFSADWNAWRIFNPLGDEVSRLTKVFKESGGISGPPAIVEELRNVNEDERIELINKELKQLLSDLLLIPIDKIDDAQKVTTMGIDSLSGLEFMCKVEEKFGTTLKPVDILKDPSPDQLVHKILTDIDNQYGLT